MIQGSEKEITAYKTFSPEDDEYYTMYSLDIFT